MKKFLALLLAVVMVLSLAACGSEAPAPAPTEAPAEQPAETPAEQPAEEPTAEPVEEYTGPDTFSMIANFDITTLDYVYNNKSSNGDYVNNFVEGLLTQDNHGKLVPGMASEWSCNDDASEWYFTIRDDAVWSTSAGEEYDAVTAEDFVTGLKHAVDSKSETLGLIADLIVGLLRWNRQVGRRRHQGGRQPAHLHPDRSLRLLRRYDHLHHPVAHQRRVPRVQGLRLRRR